MELHPDDAEAVAAFIHNNFSAITRYIGWESYTNPAEARADLIHDADDPNRFFFGVYHQGKLVGLVRLIPQSSKNTWNLVYAKDTGGPKGLMTEAIKAAILWIKDHCPQASVHAEVAHTNTQSQDLVERLGFIPIRESDRSIYYQRP